MYTRKQVVVIATIQNLIATIQCVVCVCLSSEAEDLIYGREEMEEMRVP